MACLTAAATIAIVETLIDIDYAKMRCVRCGLQRQVGDVRSAIASLQSYSFARDVERSVTVTKLARRDIGLHIKPYVISSKEHAGKQAY